MPFNSCKTHLGYLSFVSSSILVFCLFRYLPFVSSGTCLLSLPVLVFCLFRYLSFVSSGTCLLFLRVLVFCLFGYWYLSFVLHLGVSFDLSLVASLVVVFCLPCSLLFVVFWTCILYAIFAYHLYVIYLARLRFQCTKSNIPCLLHSLHVCI